MPSRLGGVEGAEVSHLRCQLCCPAHWRGGGGRQLSCAVCCSDLRVDSQKQRHPSGGVSVSSEMVFELEGVELGADGKASDDASTRAGAGTLRTVYGENEHVRWCVPVTSNAGPWQSEFTGVRGRETFLGYRPREGLAGWHLGTFLSLRTLTSSEQHPAPA